MTANDNAESRPRGVSADKRRAILAGGLTVFARDGYSRASVDAIATTASVSTRTIYNHFHDKARLFQAVIQESATRVADAQIDTIDRYLRKVTDLEEDLIELGRALVAPMNGYAEHWALVRQIKADTEHIPQAAVDEWRSRGPMRVDAELARRFELLAERGLMRIDDPGRAAEHFTLLVAGNDPLRGRGRDSGDEIPDAVTAGVHAFLYGYASRPD